MLYVNNKQGLDLAEMKNNWGIWQKVHEMKVDVTKKTTFTMQLPLPVTATNIMIEFNTVNLAKSIEVVGNGLRPGRPHGAENECEVEKESTEGLDFLLSKLPA